ncbi:MAG TPA: SDR family oxidoreductase [Candidatus Acidoferrales bacterium]|nr:SDR family oxidoreductase [Candidatus Acidoferrales bacterium]
MKVLFIGGTGIISTACTRLALERGIELTLLNRGRHATQTPPGARVVTADIEDAAAVSRALAGERFDAVVDWIAFEPAQVERDMELFRGRTRQYIFISSASAYQKPAGHYLITESTPLANPYWSYSQQKIACEERLMRAYREEGFPVTIVRPSHTYGDTQIALAVNSWAKSYTAVDRMRRGRKVIVPGDGSSLWVITHNTDLAKGFVGLLGREQAIGHAFHITSDEVMCWDQWYRLTAEAAGVEPNLLHIASDFLAACIPESRGGLTGDKAASVVFDNTKIKRFVPEYSATMPYTLGIRRTIAWFDADPARRQIDEEANARWDRLIDAYERGTAEALRIFRA